MDVLGHDDRRIDQNADRDRQPSQCHRVDPHAEPIHDQPRQNHGNGQCHCHDDRRPHVAEQQEQDDNHEHRADEDRPLNARQRVVD
jgi:hypothetical protein